MLNVFYRLKMKMLKKSTYLSVLLLVLISFKNNNSVYMTLQPQVFGLNYVKSKVSFNETYNTLRTSLENNANIKIIAEVDHAANANSVDLSLNPTRVIFFGNPNLGTPLMQKNQLVGLDLPQKIVVYQNDDNETYLVFNNTQYLASRHNLDGVTTLPKIKGALTNLTTAAGQGALVENRDYAHTVSEGLINKISNQSFKNAYDSLQAAIDNNPNLKIIAELDHSANASNAGLDLKPTRLIIFGNPKLGSQLMKNKQTTAIDLPQKILVWEAPNGIIHVSYNDSNYLSKRHGINDNQEVLKTISAALNNLSNIAVGE